MDKHKDRRRYRWLTPVLSISALLWVGTLGIVASQQGVHAAEPSDATDANQPVPLRLAEADTGSERTGGAGELVRRGRPMSEAELDEAMALLEKIKPELADQLSSLRKEDPREATRLIHQQFPRMRYLLRLKDADPPMYELRVDEVRLAYQTRDLVRQYNQAREDEDRELAGAVRDELAMLVEEHFELRQQIRQRELELLERRIAALREQIEARAGEREEVIEQRLDELIGTD